MLDYEIDLPDDSDGPAPLIILLHGRGSNRHDLMGLRPHLPKKAIVAAPEAPFAAAPWGYGPGSAWYRYLGENRPEPESFSHSLSTLHEFIEHLPKSIDMEVGDIALGGFSQGGTVSLAYALHNPGTIPCILNFSGFLAQHPAVPVTEISVSDTRFFWGHGEMDPAIPFSMAEQGWAELRAVEADLTASSYEIGHWIDPDELGDAVEWLRASINGF